LSLEERSKLHADNIKSQLDQIETFIQTEGTFRDTAYTEHELATDKRLQDIETRTQGKQEKIGQDLVAQEKHIVNVKELVHTLAGKVSCMEDNLKNNIIQTILEMVKKQRGNPLRLGNGAILQIVDSVDEEPNWDNEEGDEVDEATPDDAKKGDEEIRERSLTPLQRRNVHRSRSPVRRRSGGRDAYQSSASSHKNQRYYPDIRDTRSSARCSCPPKSDCKHRR
jgi:hypothetical protein